MYGAWQADIRPEAGSIMEKEPGRTAEVLAGERTDLAIERTIMAAGRTLMGWVRTALSMISFGFTIYKFLQATAQGAPVGLMKEQGPKRLGLFLIALGTVSMILGTTEYFQTINRLNKLSATDRYPAMNFTLVVGLLIGTLGLFLFVTIVTHTEVF
jgi:putative membrane protein